MTEIFNRLIQENITPNAYYILCCIKEKIVPKSFVNKELECKRLQSDQWLTEDLQLTSKSIIFTEEIGGFFKRTKKKVSKDLMGADFVQNIQDYVIIFPNRKLSSGKYARTNPKNLESAFKWFFETYDYSWELILEATEKYVRDYELRNFDYMRTSQYFVRKQNIDKSFESELANYCELIKTTPDVDQVYFTEAVV
jgi:hypothetical protein